MNSGAVSQPAANVGICYSFITFDQQRTSILVVLQSAANDVVRSQTGYYGNIFTKYTPYGVALPSHSHAQTNTIFPLTSAKGRRKNTRFSQLSSYCTELIDSKWARRLGSTDGDPTEDSNWTHNFTLISETRSKKIYLYTRKNESPGDALDQFGILWVILITFR